MIVLLFIYLIRGCLCRARWDADGPAYSIICFSADTNITLQTLQ